jgi:hypothetical protein
LRHLVRLAALAAVLTMTPCMAAGDGPRIAKWTFAFFCDADSELESAILWQLESLLPHCGSRDVNVVVFLDRHDEQQCVDQPGPGFTHDPIGGVPAWAGAKYLEGRRNRFRDLSSCAQSPADMGDPLTLTNFLRYVQRAYPAERRVLILNNHGNGPSGLCVDVESHPCLGSYKSILTLRELFQALSDSGTQHDPFDIVMLDACDMATVEVLQTLRPFTDYVVAAESRIHDYYPHHLVLRDVVQHPRRSPFLVARGFADAYRANLGCCDSDRFSGRMSAFDLRAFDDLDAAFGRLGRALHGGMLRDEVGTWRRFTKARCGCKRLLNANCAHWTQCAVHDLGELCERLACGEDDRIAEAAKDVLQTLRETVICSSFGIDSASDRGLSVFSPCDLTTGWVSFPDPVAESPWSQFLSKYSPCRKSPKIEFRVEALQSVRALTLEAGRATVSAFVRNVEDLCGEVYFTTADVNGTEMGPRIPVARNSLGGIEHVWQLKALYADTEGSGSIGLPVEELIPVGDGRFVGEALVRIDGRAGRLRLLLDPRTAAARPIYLVYADEGGLQSKLLPWNEDHVITARPVREGGIPAPLSPFFLGHGVVHSTSLRVAYRTLPPDEYRVGFVGVGLAGAETPFLTPIQLRD